MRRQTIVIPTWSSPARYISCRSPQIVVNEGDDVHAGESPAKMPRETTKTKDITGGLPRVAELFEARRPKESATNSEVTGKVLRQPLKGKREIVVTPGGVNVSRGNTRFRGASTSSCTRAIT
jgi:DNA-directed RNA polymerase subunit beta'